VAKAELGTKRVCPTTGRKFYDLNKDPVISPYTGEVVPIAPLPTSRRGAPAALVAPPVGNAGTRPALFRPRRPAVLRPRHPRLLPPPRLAREADAEAEGKKVAVEGDEEEVEVADDAATDDTFLETDEDEGDDVTDIIGGEREDEEDT